MTDVLEAADLLDLARERILPAIYVQEVTGNLPVAEVLSAGLTKSPKVRLKLAYVQVKASSGKVTQKAMR